MQKQTHDAEDVSMNDILGLASWDRERKDEELDHFINERLQAIGGEVTDI